jgi:hypothetical protein
MPTKAVKTTKNLLTKADENVSSSTIVKATKKLGTIGTPVMDGDRGCHKDQGCGKDIGCCGIGKCQAEMSTSLGCAGDAFSNGIRSRPDLIKEYILENKQSVVKHFKSKGVNLEQ